jgi:hypothetical protein
MQAATGVIIIIIKLPDQAIALQTPGGFYPLKSAVEERISVITS